MVHERVQWLIDSWPLTAAVVHNRYIDVLATNSLARALIPTFHVGENNLLSLLTDPNDRVLQEGWEALTARSVALLRSMFSQRDNDPGLRALVAELSVCSDRFRELWERCTYGPLMMRPPLLSADSTDRRCDVPMRGRL